MQLAPPATSSCPRIRRQRKGAIHKGAWEDNRGEGPDLEKADVVQRACAFKEGRVLRVEEVEVLEENRDRAPI